MLETTDNPLWAVHVLGPDDLHAATSHADALALCDELNALGLQNNADKTPGDQRYVIHIAYPMPWPLSPEAHAESLALRRKDEAEWAARKAAYEAKVTATGAPRRGFEELTAEVLDTLIRNSGKDVVLLNGPRPDAGPERAEWDRQATEHLLSRLKTFDAPVIPKGWKLVPTQISPEMVAAAFALEESLGWGATQEKIWEATLAAAPPAPLLNESEVWDAAKRTALEEAIEATQSVIEPHEAEKAIRALIKGATNG